MTTGILRSAAGCASIADLWPGAGTTVVVSPPAPAAEAAGAELVVLDLPDADLAEGLAIVRASGAAGAVISLSPTVPFAVLRRAAGSGPALFRAVIPLGVRPGEGVVALAAEPGTKAERVRAAMAALAWVGVVEVMGEDALDAVAALTLGGAAFLCEALQGMEDGAVRDGLSRDLARAFAGQTALATAVLLTGRQGSPADLKDLVASPGGTTIAALASLEDAGMRGAYLRAVQRTAVEVRRRRDAVSTTVVE
jgi:pyrroline-5-carboxylate reductase